MWRRWMAFPEGYVIIEIQGQKLEKFFNLALNRNITFWDLNRLSGEKIQACMSLRHFLRLRPVVRQTGCRVRILDKQGPYFWWRRLRKRRVFLSGFLLFLAGLYLLSTFVWVVDVLPLNELKKVSREQILAAAESSGLGRGAWKGKLNVRHIEQEILLKVPQLAWVGVSFRGATARIEVVEKLFPPPGTETELPAHILAAKDGLITEILVLSGQGRVAVGDTVRQGDILISGIILPPPAEGPPESGTQNTSPLQPRLVRARGIVRARVWYEVEAEVGKEEVKEILTGRQATALLLRLPHREILLKGEAASPFTTYRQENKILRLPSWRNFTIPVELIIMTYFETSVERALLTRKQAEARAQEQALAALRRVIPARSRILGEKIVQTWEEGGHWRVGVMVETEEEIGQTVTLTKE
ncbi:MAG: sporulation protein YqfD [Moorellaceae bacterium]